MAIRSFLREFAMEHKVEAYALTLGFILILFLVTFSTIMSYLKTTNRNTIKAELIPVVEQEIRTEYNEWCELPENKVEDYSFIESVGRFLF